jgi:DNA-binding NtrC family response regulator
VVIVMMTAFATVETAREAFKLGADDFIQKPFDIDELKLIVAKGLEKLALKEEIKTLIKEQRERGNLGNIIGRSDRMQAVYQMIETVAEVQSTVLVTGESGTGKELVARAIHDLSPRAERPFVSINCGAFTETLLESELFGYVKGSFTGANTNRKGLFEAANRGTIFLDEIGEMSAAMQVKLLRVLQEREFERVGGAKTLAVDIRLIAACNRDLEQEVACGRFRSDLFFRLNVVPLVLPPLRQRHEDIPLLAAHFAAKAADKHGRTRPELDPALVEALQEYDWPGNVRELENLMERLVVLTSTPRLGLEFLPEKMLRTAPDATATDETTLEGALSALKRRMITGALSAESGNKAAAAKRLGISRSYLHRLLSEYEDIEK